MCSAQQHHTDRLFFALLPSAAVIERIERLAEALRREQGLQGGLLGAERYHVTLYYLGEFAGLSAEQVEVLCAAAVTALPSGPVALEFDRVASFSRRQGHRPVVLLGEAGVAELKAFQQHFAVAMSAQGIVGDHRPYIPHLTLLYETRDVSEQPIEPIGWIADEVVLQRSLIGQGRHEILARWQL